ncbi:hypothetical protein V1523DRAFT_421885 [Lipomyces doorenjongii]
MIIGIRSHGSTWSSIAESLGMLRSMSGDDIADDERAFWRRIWWCGGGCLHGNDLRIAASQRVMYQSCRA